MRIILFLILTVSLNAQTSFWWLMFGDNSVEINITDGLYQFPDSGRFYSPWSTGHPWTPPSYNQTNNTIDLVFQARDIIDVTRDTNFIYLQSFDLDKAEFNTRVKVYENSVSPVAPYNGSNYDWDHIGPYLGRMGNTYLCLFGSHGSSAFGFTSNISFGNITNKDTVLVGGFDYHTMSTQFNDEIWINLRGSGNNRRSIYSFDGNAYNLLTNYANFSGMGDYYEFWAYASRAYNEINGTEKRSITLLTLRDDGTSLYHYARYGIVEIKRNAGVNTYFDSFGNPVSVPIDSALFVDPVEVFNSGTNAAFNWSTPVVLGNTIAFPVMVNDTNAKLKIFRRIESAWDTLDVLTIPNVNVAKWKDWYYYNQDVYFVVGGSGIYDHLTTDYTLTKSCDTLYLYKYTNLFGDTRELSIIDTIYQQASGDNVGAFHSTFVQNGFTEQTGYLGILTWEHIGNPTTRMDTTGGNGYYYFTKIGNE